MTPVLLADFVVFPSPRNPDCIAAEEPEDRAVTVVGQSSLVGPVSSPENGVPGLTYHPRQVILS